MNIQRRVQMSIVKMIEADAMAWTEASVATGSTMATVESAVPANIGTSL